VSSQEKVFARLTNCAAGRRWKPFVEVTVNAVSAGLEKKLEKSPMDYLPSFAVDFLAVKRESENKSDAFCIEISLQGFFDAYSIANPNITLP
jgi:hypothetical protein